MYVKYINVLTHEILDVQKFIDVLRYEILRYTQCILMYLDMT